MARSRRRSRRNPASSKAASAFQPSERATLAGPSASSRRASGRPAPRPRPDRVASDRASARPSSASKKPSSRRASKRPASKKPASVAVSKTAIPAKKKSALPTVVAVMGGAVVLGGLVWWLVSRKAQAAESAPLTREEIYRSTPRGRGIEIKPFSPKEAKAAREAAAAEGRTFYLRSKDVWISKEDADTLISTGWFHLGKEGRNVMRTNIRESLPADVRSLVDSIASGR